MVVEINSRVVRIVLAWKHAISDFTWLSSRTNSHNIGNRNSFAAFFPSTFKLVSSYSATPIKSSLAFLLNTLNFPLFLVCNWKRLQRLFCHSDFFNQAKFNHRSRLTHRDHNDCVIQIIQMVVRLLEKLFAARTKPGHLT